MSAQAVPCRVQSSGPKAMADCEDSVLSVKLKKMHAEQAVLSL